jgi:SM-20-related protein
MKDALHILNLDTIREAQLHNDPFPYMIIKNVINPKFISQISETFPAIKTRGSFPLNALSYGGAFKGLIGELQHPQLKKMIGERLAMDLDDKPSVITLRGHTTERDGHIHVDSETKLVTVLLYLNQGWQNPAGRLRLLYNKKNLDHYAAEVSPEAGTCLIFKVTSNCWHGHAPFIGERRSIQLNYVTSDEVADHHLKRHRLSAFLKKYLFRKNEKARSSY